MERPVTVADRDWSGANPSRYPDPAIKILDPRFQPYYLGHTPVQRLYTGALWAEGPCWFGDGRYLLWSDIPQDRMLRWAKRRARLVCSASLPITPTVTPVIGKGA